MENQNAPGFSDPTQTLSRPVFDIVHQKKKVSYLKFVYFRFQSIH